MTTPTIYKDHNSFYLVQDIQGLDNYEKAKAISTFVSKSTKLLEMYLDSELEKIFAENFILLKDNDKVSIRKAFEKLNAMGKKIEILDLFGGKDFEKCELITKTKGSEMTIVIEENRYLECGIRLSEVKI